MGRLDTDGGANAEAVLNGVPPTIGVDSDNEAANGAASEVKAADSGSECEGCHCFDLSDNFVCFLCMKYITHTGYMQTRFIAKCDRNRIEMLYYPNARRTSSSAA